MSTLKVLFVCIHNSARSQMAEAFLNKYANKRFIAESAGLEPGQLNPIVVEAMAQIGIDISKNQTKSVADIIRQGKQYDYVITVCDEASAERCPVFPGRTQRLHWGFADPSRLNGTFDEKKATICKIRDEIKQKIKNWIETTR